MGLRGQDAVVVVFFAAGLLLSVEENPLNLIHDLGAQEAPTRDV